MAERQPSDQDGHAIQQRDPYEFPTSDAFRLINDAHTKLCVAGSELDYPLDEETPEHIRELENKAREAVMDLFRAMCEERGFNDAEFENVYLDSGSAVWEDTSENERGDA